MPSQQKALTAFTSVGPEARSALVWADTVLPVQFAGDDFGAAEADATPSDVARAAAPTSAMMRFMGNPFGMGTACSPTPPESPPERDGHEGPSVPTGEGVVPDDAA